MWDFLKRKKAKSAFVPTDFDPDEEQEHHDSKVLKALYSWVLVLLGFSVLVSVQFPFFQEVHKRSGAFVEEAAFALILAGLFSLTVEKYHREEFRRFVIVERRKLKRDVFLYAYGHAVAEETRQEIKDLILDCPFHRDELRLEWHFAPAKDASDKIRLTKIFSYTQRNGTKIPQPYTYRLHQNTTSSVLKQVSENQTQTVKIRRKSKDDINLEKSHAQISGEPTSDQIRELQTDEIGQLQSGEEMYVSVTITETRPILSDDSYSSKHPVVGKTLVSVYVDAGLDLVAAAYCQSKALEIRTEHNPPAIHAWHIRRGILPFQGINVSWSPAPSKPLPAPALDELATTAPPKAEVPETKKAEPEGGLLPAPPVPLVASQKNDTGTANG